MRKWILYCAVAVLLYQLPNFCKRQTDGFSIMRITPDLPADVAYPEMELNNEEREELECALDQPYAYLGRGGQCFVFVSRDGHYVCKFFRTEFHPFGSLWWQTLPFFSHHRRERLFAHAHSKLQRDFTSYFLAGQELKKETGTLYMHLTATTHLKKVLRIRDKLGIDHAIDLDRFSFAVQRRAELAFSYIERCVQDDLEKAHAAVSALIALSVARCQKGIYDEDAKIHKNYGFIDGHPLFIDLGRFVKDPSRKEPQVYHRDIDALSLQIKEKFPLLFVDDSAMYD
jgi:hypothetical protein